MTDLAQNLLDARAILEGRSMMLPTVAHLRALWLHHEDSLILAAMKVARAHDEIMEMP